MNERRGSQSLGLYNGVDTIKIAENPLRALKSVPRAFYEKGMVLGHTRQMTHGGISEGNCHPFLYGDILGAHNGVVANFHDRLRTIPELAKMSVDSELIFWTLNKFGKSGLKGRIIGPAAIWWIDMRSPESVNLLTNGGNPLHFVQGGEFFAFSSEEWPLGCLWSDLEIRKCVPGIVYKLNRRSMKLKMKPCGFDDTGYRKLQPKSSMQGQGALSWNRSECEERFRAALSNCNIDKRFSPDDGVACDTRDSWGDVLGLSGEVGESYFDDTPVGFPGNPQDIYREEEEEVEGGTPLERGNASRDLKALLWARLSDCFFELEGGLWCECQRCKQGYPAQQICWNTRLLEFYCPLCETDLLTANDIDVDDIYLDFEATQHAL